MLIGMIGNPSKEMCSQHKLLKNQENKILKAADQLRQKMDEIASGERSSGEAFAIQLESQENLKARIDNLNDQNEFMAGPYHDYCQQLHNAKIQQGIETLKAVREGLNNLGFSDREGEPGFLAAGVVQRHPKYRNAIAESESACATLNTINSAVQRNYAEIEKLEERLTAFRKKITALA